MYDPPRYVVVDLLMLVHWVKFFQLTGSALEKCEAIVYLKYDFFTLLNEKEPKLNLIAAIDSVFEKVDRNSVASMPGAEKEYYKELWGMRAAIKRGKKVNLNPNILN